VIQSALGIATRRSTRLRLGSMRSSRPRPKSATQTLRNAKAMPFGWPPTRIVLITLFRRGPMRLTVPEPSLLTQSEPAPNASAYGAAPTRMRAWRRLVLALTRVTRAVYREPTQTLPAP
jgi:hypothetical protein